MNVLQFLMEFGLTKLNIFSSMVLTYTSAQREYSHNTIMRKGSQKMFEPVSVGLAESIVSEDSLGSTSCGENSCEMTRNPKKYLEDIEPYHGDPVGI
ncbi:CNT_HP2_G0028560.mRNA.1.CDS.1 [Saccharomyces cerevisiae]|nr:CNT_HP2_G0028560.mRNA.1.CDS.1 [Saccharomyces cerevisiae]CAI6804377.1 CNT_HP2_G0028560.mRNA.1.CDS.1 [Saccharomyces cerevisiae]